MVLFTRCEKARKEKLAASYKALVDYLVDCDVPTFLARIETIQEWDRSRDDLYVWIPILDRMDELLSKVAEKYNYKQDSKKESEVKLLEMEEHDVIYCLKMLQFTRRLLLNTENRFVYSSGDVLIHLLNCPNFTIKLAVMRILAILGERFVIAREKIVAHNIFGDHDLRKNALKLALSLSSSVMDEDGEHFSLVDLYFDKKKVPQKWRKLRFTHYTSNGFKKSNLSKNNGNEVTSIKKVTMTSQELCNHSLQEIFNKGMELLPSESWFDFSVKASVAKAFSDDSNENKDLRNLIIETKLNAIAFVNTIFSPPQVSSKLFELDPYAFNSLTDLISLSETKIPKELRTDALFTLECISLKHVWCSDIIRNLGGNISHGLLFQILRYIAKTLREATDEVDEEYNVRFFYLISNLADVKPLHESLFAAGLIPTLLEIVSIRNCSYKRTLASATHLLETFIDNSETATEFIENDGFTMLITSVANEIDFTLEHPETWQPPKYSVVYYSISFRELAYIRSLLKLVLKLLSTDSGDRIRNLIDSPILVSLKKILENKFVFGLNLITYTLDVVQKVINSEPTIYPVLVEAGLIPYIVDNFPKLLGPSAELLSLLPDVISAICLNSEGLNQVKEKGLINHLFDFLLDADHARILTGGDRSTEYGTDIDELARHYPDLKANIVEALCDVIRKMPSAYKDEREFLFTSPKDEKYFFHEKNEEVLVDKEEHEPAYWELLDKGTMLDTFTSVLFGMSLGNGSFSQVPQHLEAKDFLAILFMENPPYEYFTSVAISNVTEVLQYLDEKYEDYAFMDVMKALNDQLENLSEFLNSPNDTSFFLAKDGDTSIRKCHSKLCRLAAILNIVTNVYVDLTTLSCKRIMQIYSYFNKSGFSLIKNLKLLLQKCALEEMYLRQHMPDSIITETMPLPIVDVSGDGPPLQIYIHDPKKGDQKGKVTSIKTRNTLQVRTTLYTLQSNTAVLFRCFLRLSHSRSMDLEHKDLTTEIHIFENVVENVLEMLKVTELEGHLPYFLVLLNFNTFVFTIPKASPNSTEILQTIPAYIFYQKGGYLLYLQIIRDLFTRMTKIKDLSSLDNLNYIDESNGILTLSCLINALTFINKSMQTETMENVQSIGKYYVSVDEDYNIMKALTVPIKVMALAMILDLDKSDGLFKTQSRNVPYSVFKQLLSMLKNVFTTVNIHTKELYELHWDLVFPPIRKINLFEQVDIPGDVAANYLTETGDDLPTDNSIGLFSPEQWEKYVKLAGEDKSIYYPQPIQPQYYKGCTSKELDELRDTFFNDGLPSRIFTVLPFYPKLVNAFAKTLLQIFTKYDEPNEVFAGKILDRILETRLDDPATLSSLIHLFGIFLNEKYIYQKASHLMQKFIEYLEKSLKPEHVNTPWFSKALYVYEIIIAKSELPQFEELSKDVLLRYPLLSMAKVFRIPESIKQKLFDILIRVSDISNFYSALATSRILIFYSRDEFYANNIARSGILSRLLKVIGSFQKLDKINFLESSFLLLTRRCFETTENVDNLIRAEVDRSFTARPLGDGDDAVRELTTILEEKAHVVMRSPSQFIDILCETARFQEFDEQGALIDYSLKRFLDKKKEDTRVILDKADIYERTGIMHLLLSQLMAASEKDWLSEPANSSDLPENKKNQLDPSRNPVCAYMVFLLKLLVELVSSYNQCKFEFLTFSRRNTYAERPRPRTTAANFFLYRLLDKPVGNDHDKHEAKRREVVGMLARSVIIGFLATVQDDKTIKSDVKIVDPHMNFIRKFAIEAIMKAIRNATSSSKLLEGNHLKLDMWFRIITSMVYVQAPHLRQLLDPNKVEADQYQLCKLVIDLGLPSVITEAMASIDLNYPFSKKIFNVAVEALNTISSTRNNFSEHFKIEDHDEVDDEVDESDKEEIPDMFKNSALGMYDVEDIEEDDDDDDDTSLIGDGDAMAFVDSDNGFEVVFSDEDDDMGEEGEEDVHSRSEENDLSSEMNSSTTGGSDVDYEVDDAEGLVINIEQQSGDDEDMADYDIDHSHSSRTGDEDEGSMDVIEVYDDELSSEYDVDLSDYDVDESDWDSGLSSLSISDEEGESSENEPINSTRMGDSRRRWLIAEGVELSDDSQGESEDDGRDVFRDIEHIFSNENEPLFRVHDEMRHRNHRRSINRTHFHSAMSAPSLSLLNRGRRNQSNLINPLGPTGLEQIENDISDQVTVAGSGSRPRSHHLHFSEVLLSGGVFDEPVLDGIILKSTVSRWKDIFDMFYDSKTYANCIIPTVINRIYRVSLDLQENSEKHKQGKSKDKHPIFSEPRVESISSTDAISAEEDSVQASNVSHDDHEPVFVTIQGSEVDIGGTDIDPEFMNALPDDIRADVFAQHVRERRAEARLDSEHNAHSREIDSDFLEAIPEDIREGILDTEAEEQRMFVRIGSSANVLRADDGAIDNDEEAENLDHENSDDRNIAEPEKKKPARMYFAPLIDRAGIASLMKSVFISKPYIQREIYHELFYRLCSSKQNRNDLMNTFLFILSEGIIDQHSLEKVYNIISSRAMGHAKATTVRQLPPDCTPLTVANQTIEILQNLIDADSRLKYFLIAEHDNLIVNKANNKSRKEVLTDKKLRWPLWHLFSLLDRKLITDESVLMDLLTRILQVCTKTLAVLSVSSSGKENLNKKFHLPDFDEDDLMKILSIITLDSCTTRVFQQTLNIIYNLCKIKGCMAIFTQHLVSLAIEIMGKLKDALDGLSREVSTITNGMEINSELLQKFTLPSSDQAKLLKILTTVDFLYTHKRKEEERNIKDLQSLYDQMNSGSVWSSLSECLTQFEKSQAINTSATILLPLIESLMVVCRRSDLSQNRNTANKYEDAKLLDFSKTRVENLFFPFTDAHKKLLNQMIRSNPKLMSGPFALLVKNPKVLDFDNKRYFFNAKLKPDNQERPKLPITVRREQVFLDSYRALFFKTNDEIKNSRLEITFKGESGVDAGGLTREWYQVLSRQMFNPDYALFLPVPSDKTTFHPNRTSGINPEHLSFFKFTGMVIGKAIRDQCFLDCHFSREVYKDILGRPVSLKDMESLDPDYYKSLVWILENDITDIIDETFSVETDDYGEHKVIDLTEGGKDIMVTELNKQDYVKKIVEYKLQTSVKEQMDNFLVGFYALISKDLITIFDEQELELLISGLPDIDVDDWKNNTTYVNYTATCKEVNYFWRAVRSFDAEERAKLLQFVTGTSKVPLNGFKELSGVNGVCKFSIHRDFGSSERLPSSHTCFNQLNLPPYESYETLRGSLLLAINEGHEGFGLA
ncbi:hypothetical protein SEUBUCD646_0B05560 [Saccharomyces eubayanus]|uniref:HECT-type E3 ubiquitin transferase n=1 Tax=Saccharomyces eubayanus TaxID=1080349 RepID=A0ABN8VKZ2_SACEU|nr:hypothetical protein SEUBUCD650_0B05560 [Saccharomyces eubayanus]CAI1893000.1 hypothetical protein SEUBUCD646_0B05560 [Saccharomyces eubayanus]